MKKNYLLTALLTISLVLPLMAQKKDTVYHETKWYIGVGINLNSVWIINQNTYGEPKLDYKITPGIGGNIAVGFDYNDHFGFKMEVGYAQMGQKYGGTQYDTAATRNIKLNYLLVPIMMKYRTGGKKTRFYVMAGPEFALLLSATQTYQRNGVNAPPYYNKSIGWVNVSETSIKSRYTGAAGCARLDLGVELSPSKNLIINVGLSNFFSITDLNAYSYRYIESGAIYHISHDYYFGLNLGLSYIL